MLLNMYVSIYVYTHISRPPVLAVITDQKRFPCVLVENINSAITTEIHFIELTFVVSGTFKMTARCFCAFSGVDICVCVKSAMLFLSQRKQAIV